MASEIVRTEDGTHVIDGADDVGLTQRQITALENLYALGAGPRASLDDKFDSNPQIRALQMVYEGKLGGPGRGQGRPSRDQRISVTLTEYVRTTLAPKVKTALDRALRQDAGERINLDAIKLIVEMEHKEAKLQLSEDAADIDNLSKEELLATLFDLVNDAQTSGVIEATFTEGTAGASGTAVEVPSAKDLAAINRAKATRRRAAKKRRAAKQPDAVAGAGEHNGDSPHSSANGVDTGSAEQDRRGATARDREAHPNPVAQAALRRAANRR
jgi:hypothetical protein